MVRCAYSTHPGVPRHISCLLGSRTVVCFKCFTRCRGKPVRTRALYGSYAPRPHTVHAMVDAHHHAALVNMGFGAGRTADVLQSLAAVSNTATTDTDTANTTSTGSDMSPRVHLLQKAVLLLLLEPTCQEKEQGSRASSWDYGRVTAAPLKEFEARAGKEASHTHTGRAGFSPRRSESDCRQDRAGGQADHAAANVSHSHAASWRSNTETLVAVSDKTAYGVRVQASATAATATKATGSATLTSEPERGGSVGMVSSSTINLSVCTSRRRWYAQTLFFLAVVATAYLAYVYAACGCACTSAYIRRNKDAFWRGWGMGLCLLQSLRCHHTIVCGGCL